MSDYLERWFRDLGVAGRAADDRAGPRQPARPVRRARRAADDPLRRPPGHGADRRDDDRPVRARASRAAGSTAGARATSRGGWRRCSSPSPGWSRERPGGLGVGGHGLHGRRGVHPHRLVATWRATAHGADLAIVAEPTRLDLVDRHKGAVRWKVRTTGRRLPQLDARTSGVNAIYRMARVVAAPGRLRRRAGAVDARPGPRAAEPVGRPDRGGAERQRRARLVRDRGRPPGDPRRGPAATARTGSGLPPRAARDARRRRVPPALGQHAAALARTSGPGDWLEPVARRDRAGDRAAARGRRASPTAPTPGRSARPGLPCLVFGPGDIAQAHTKDEWIELDQVRRGGRGVLSDRRATSAERRVRDAPAVGGRRPGRGRASAGRGRRRLRRRRG